MEEFLQFCKIDKTQINLNSEDKKIIRWLKQLFINELGLDIEFSNFVNQRLIKFTQEFTFFDDFFKQRSFKEVLIPSSYWSAGIVAAARKNSIIVSDIQYALISKYHPSFAFPISGRAYGADRIYLWSKYWNINEVPFNKSFIIDNNYYMEKFKALNLRACTEKKYDVAFVSQSRIGYILFDWMIKFSILNPLLKIVFCSHPDEDISSYKDFIKLKSLSNVFVTNNETIKDMALSENVVGVYSTSMFEALALRKKVFIAKINGYDILEREIENEYMTLVENHFELAEKIKYYENKNTIDYSKLFFSF